MMTPWEIANAAAQLAREEQLKAYYAQRTAAGETPPPTTGGAAAPAASRIVKIRYSNSSASNPSPNKSILSLANVPVGAITVSDPEVDWGVDEWQGDTGLLLEGPGIIDILVTGYVDSLNNDPINTTGARLNIYIYGNSNDSSQGHFMHVPYMFGEEAGSQMEFGAQLRGYIDEDWGFSPGHATSTHNVLLGVVVVLPNNGVGEDLGFKNLNVDILWTPLTSAE